MSIESGGYIPDEARIKAKKKETNEDSKRTMDRRSRQVTEVSQEIQDLHKEKAASLQLSEDNDAPELVAEVEGRTIKGDGYSDLHLPGIEDRIRQQEYSKGRLMEMAKNPVERARKLTEQYLKQLEEQVDKIKDTETRKQVKEWLDGRDKLNELRVSEQLERIINLYGFLQRTQPNRYNSGRIDEDELRIPPIGMDLAQLDLDVARVRAWEDEEGV